MKNRFRGFGLTSQTEKLECKKVLNLMQQVKKWFMVGFGYIHYVTVLQCQECNMYVHDRVKHSLLTSHYEISQTSEKIPFYSFSRFEKVKFVIFYFLMASLFFGVGSNILANLGMAEITPEGIVPPFWWIGLSFFLGLIGPILFRFIRWGRSRKKSVVPQVFPLSSLELYLGLYLGSSLLGLPLIIVLSQTIDVTTGLGAFIFLVVLLFVLSLSSIGFYGGLFIGVRALFHWLMSLKGG